MTAITREQHHRNNLGTMRYMRYKDAFDRVEHCLQEKYYLEAVAILDSLIGDRLGSRLSYLQGQEVEVKLACGQLCSKLLGSEQKGGFEKDSEFQAIIQKIQLWCRNRNKAMHETAKIIRSDDLNQDFATLLETHRQSVVEGMDLLRRFDNIDTVDRQKNGKIPATFPNAFGTKGE